MHPGLHDFTSHDVSSPSVPRLSSPLEQHPGLIGLPIQDTRTHVATPPPTRLTTHNTIVIYTHLPTQGERRRVFGSPTRAVRHRRRGYGDWALDPSPTRGEAFSHTTFLAVPYTHSRTHGWPTPLKPGFPWAQGAPSLHIHQRKTLPLTRFGNPHIIAAPGYLATVCRCFSCHRVSIILFFFAVSARFQTYNSSHDPRFSFQQPPPRVPTPHSVSWFIFFRQAIYAYRPFIPAGGHRRTGRKSFGYNRRSPKVQDASPRREGRKRGEGGSKKRAGDRGGQVAPRGARESLVETEVRAHVFWTRKGREGHVLELGCQGKRKGKGREGQGRAGQGRADGGDHLLLGSGLERGGEHGEGVLLATRPRTDHNGIFSLGGKGIRRGKRHRPLGRLFLLPSRAEARAGRAATRRCRSSFFLKRDETGPSSLYEALLALLNGKRKDGQDAPVMGGRGGWGAGAGDGKAARLAFPPSPPLSLALQSVFEPSSGTRKKPLGGHLHFH